MARCGSCSIANADQVTAPAQIENQSIGPAIYRKIRAGAFPAEGVCDAEIAAGRRKGVIGSVAASQDNAALRSHLHQKCKCTVADRQSLIRPLHASPQTPEIDKLESRMIARTSICTHSRKRLTRKGRSCPRRAKRHAQRCRSQARVAAEQELRLHHGVTTSWWTCHVSLTASFLGTVSWRGGPTPSVVQIVEIVSRRTKRSNRAYGGESVSQSSLKDQVFSTFPDQNPPFELPPEWNFAFDKSLSRPMDGHRQQCHQATSERQIAVAPLSLGRGRLPSEGEGHTFESCRVRHFCHFHYANTKITANRRRTTPEQRAAISLRAKKRSNDAAGQH